MLFEQILFFLFAVLAIGGAVAVVLITNPFYSVLSLVIHLVALAALFLLLRAEFIALAQVVVYAGAVMVLYVFVVAYIGGADEPLSGGGRRGLVLLGPLFALALVLELAFAIVGSSLAGLDETGAAAGPGFGSTGQIGALLLSRYLVPFEAASFLLLVAAVGAVVLARRRREPMGEPLTPATSLAHAAPDEVARGERPYLPSTGGAG